jgi:hypothetical protein
MLACVTIRLKSDANNRIYSRTEGIAQIMEPQPKDLSGVEKTKRFCDCNNGSRRGADLLSPACLPPQLALRQL